MHYPTVFNTYKFTDFTTLRFALPSVLQVKGNFVLILALASNNLSVFAFSRLCRYHCISYSDQLECCLLDFNG